MKIKKALKKVDKTIDEMCDYLNLFNSPFAPRGEGARQEACKEFHLIMKNLHKNLNNLEEAVLNEFDWSIETIKYMD